jgi:hypothetical protein
MTASVSSMYGLKGIGSVEVDTVVVTAGGYGSGGYGCATDGTRRSHSRRHRRDGFRLVDDRVGAYVDDSFGVELEHARPRLSFCPPSCESAGESSSSRRPTASSSPRYEFSSRPKRKEVPTRTTSVRSPRQRFATVATRLRQLVVRTLVASNRQAIQGISGGLMAPPRLRLRRELPEKGQNERRGRAAWSGLSTEAEGGADEDDIGTLAAASKAYPED